MSSNLTLSAKINQQVWIEKRNVRKSQTNGFRYLEISQMERRHASSHAITEVGYSLATRWLQAKRLASLDGIASQVLINSIDVRSEVKRLLIREAERIRKLVSFPTLRRA